MGKNNNMSTFSRTPRIFLAVVAIMFSGLLAFSSPHKVSATCYYGPGVGDYSQQTNYVPASVSIGASYSSGAIDFSGSASDSQVSASECTDGYYYGNGTDSHIGILNEYQGGATLSSLTVYVNGQPAGASVTPLGNGNYEFSGSAAFSGSGTVSVSVSASFSGNYYMGSGSATYVPSETASDSTSVNVPPPQPPQCPAATTETVNCPSGYTPASFTRTTSYSGASCTPTVTDSATCSPTVTSCPSNFTEDIGCPAGYSGNYYRTTTYGSAPSCSVSYTYDYQCTPPPEDATVSIQTNLAGSSWTLSPGGLTGQGTTAVTVYPGSSGTTYSITPQNVAGYSYSVSNSITGPGSSATVFPGQQIGFTVTYTAAPSFAYSLSNSGTSNVTKGGVNQFTQNTITKTLTSGTTQGVTLSLSGIPAGVSGVPSSQGCSPTCSSVITFTVTPSASAGTYPITVTGTPNNVTTSFNLVIANSPDIVVSCSASPNPAKVGQAVAWTGNVSGGVPPYTYSWSGAGITGAANTNPLSVTYSTTGTKTATLTVTDSLSNTGSCTPAGTATININPKFEEF